MAYDEEQARKSRVVVETPNARREVVQSEAVRVPERDGISTATVGVLVIIAVGLVTLLLLVLMTGRTGEYTTGELAEQQTPTTPQTTIVEQPAPPPVIIQQPAPAQPPIIIQQPAPAGGSVSELHNDAAIQAEIERRIADDPNLSGLGITVTTANGKVTILGTVRSEAIKMEIERMVRAVRGVLQVDNQIEVTG